MLSLGVGEYKYSYERDILNLFRHIGRVAALQMTKGYRDTALHAYLTHTGATEQDLVEAAVALARFQGSATHPAGHALADAWVHAGLDRLNPAARLTLEATVGRACMSAFHHYTREAYARGAQSPGADETAAALDKAADAFRASEAARREVAREAAAALDRPGAAAAQTGAE